ncbi:hypothetical protein CASFOL_020472 [Castilleja foliolosa]|uniref:MACPF domain-containing protein n=1 Tax=Castilleja foliolosa TaxID=1961234 RepID=A0ABD3D0Y5_9LAMI
MSNGIVQKALSSLGKGFDITSDFRLKYCKGDQRLIILNETDTGELLIPGFGSFNNVSVDIKSDKGDRTRYQSDILDFNQMSEFVNRKSSLPGKIPTGLFNSMFGFQSGSWAVDAANTKYLGIDGYFIAIFNVHVDRYPLILADEVRNDVPTTWDPSALARFIEKYGTHIIVGLSIGGKDMVLLKQDKCSNMEPSQLKNHLDNLGDQLFNGTCSFYPHQLKTYKEHKNKAPQAFNVFDPQPNLIGNYASITAKDGISVICSKRGGDSSVNTHCEWLPTVPHMPDAIHFNFIPITSLLRGVPGKGFLSHAINLYLRYKPPIGDLRYFLDFQGHKIWAPIHNDLPLGPARNKALNRPALQFNLMGPKLYVNTTQVTSENTPVTGMRLYLEGVKANRHPSPALHKPSDSHTPTTTNLPIMGRVRTKARQPPLLRAHPMEKILTHLHRPSQIRPELAYHVNKARPRRLHRHRGPAPRQQTRLEKRAPPEAVIFHDLKLLHRTVELDGTCVRESFDDEVGFFLVDKYFDNGPRGEGHACEPARDCGFGGLPDGPSNHGDEEDVEICGHVGDVSRAVG